MMEAGSGCSYMFISNIKLGWPAIFLLAVLLLSLTMNGCICAAIGHMKPPHKGGFNWLIISMTTCDIIAVLTLVPLSVARAYLGTLPGPWWMNDLWMYIALAIVSLVGSHLCVLCVETYFSIEPPLWYSRLSRCNGINLLKVGTACIPGLVIPTAVVAWRTSKITRWGKGQGSDDCWTEDAQQDSYILNMSLTTQYNETASPGITQCPWVLEIILPVILCCYLLPLLISITVYSIAWSKVKQALKGVFVRGGNKSSSDKAAKESLLHSMGSIKENGNKATELAQKLTASLKRSNSGSRRCKRESSMQHRASVLDRHPSLRYSIKRQPSNRSETTRASLRRSRKSSPNPSHSGLCGDHHGLVAKLSWNSTVSDMDHPRSASPAFLEKVPICHSIADLISTPSGDQPAQSFQQSTQQQNASYCNLYVEQNMGLNCSRSEKLSQDNVSSHSINEDETQTPGDEQGNDSIKKEMEDHTMACGISFQDQDNIPFADEPEIQVPIILNKDDDMLGQSKEPKDYEAPQAGPSLINQLTYTESERGTSPCTDLNTQVIQGEKPSQESSAKYPDQGTPGDGKVEADQQAQTNIHVSEEMTMDQALSDNENKRRSNSVTDDEQSINKNLLTAGYHYESLPVTEEKTRSTEKGLSPSHRIKHTIHDTRYFLITLGALLLMHYLTCLPLVILLISSLHCMQKVSFLIQFLMLFTEWTLYAGILARPFLYIGFHLSLRKELCNLIKCSTSAGV